MSDQILSREEIAQMADRAAAQCARTGRVPANPFAPHAPEWRQFKVDFERYLVLHTAPQDVEGGA